MITASKYSDDVLFVKEVLILIAQNLGFITKVHAQKYYFLADVEYYSRFEHRIHSNKLISFKHGPYYPDLTQAFDALEQDSRVDVASGDGWVGIRVKDKDAPVGLPLDVIEAVAFTCSEFKTKKDVIKEVVYQYAVYAATPYNEEIDFSIFDAYSIKDLIRPDEVKTSQQKASEDQEIYQIVHETPVPRFI